MENLSYTEIEHLIARCKAEISNSDVSEENIGLVAVFAAMQTVYSENPIAHSTTNTRPNDFSDFQETFAEWAMDYKLESFHDRFLAAAAYLYQTGSQQVVNVNDIIHLFDNARWEKPKNPADVFSKGAKRLHFTEAERTEADESNLKSWRLTRTGYNYFLGLREAKHE